MLVFMSMRSRKLRQGCSVSCLVGLRFATSRTGAMRRFSGRCSITFSSTRRRTSSSPPGTSSMVTCSSTFPNSETASSKQTWESSSMPGNSRSSFVATASGRWCQSDRPLLEGRTTSASARSAASRRTTTTFGTTCGCCPRIKWWCSTPIPPTSRESSRTKSSTRWGPFTSSRSPTSTTFLRAASAARYTSSSRQPTQPRRR
mmetsp:Transcript_9838/g.18893  ORF Transcript_9838/g.18893 Transcript_9838/m.18893 type:complete len:202 (+) Transcript_9838:56-661(+)